MRRRQVGKARDQAAAAMRLFAQRIRVCTPYHLLRAAIAGPTCSSRLLVPIGC